MKIIYISTSLSMRAKKNVCMERIYCREAFEKGHFPFSPHLYLPQFAELEFEADARKAERLCWRMLEQSAEVWVFGPVKTKEVTETINYAKEHNIPIRYFDSHGNAI